MAHFAKISEENKVLTVLYIENKLIEDENGVEQESIGQAYLEKHNNWPANLWIRTSYNTHGNQHADGKTPLLPVILYINTNGMKLIRLGIL